MITNILAFIATIVALVAFNVTTGRTPGIVLQLIVGILVFGIANAISASRRHAPKKMGITAPVLEVPPEADNLVLSNDDGDIKQVDSECVQTQFTPASCQESGQTPRLSLGAPSLNVGRILNGRLMLTRDELNDVRTNCHQFNNVLVLRKPEPAMSPGSGPIKWYLVLSQDSAVFFNQAVDQIWSVEPSGVSIVAAATQGWQFRIESIDGRIEKFRIDPTDTASDCIIAWKSASFEEFMRSSPTNWPRGSGLLGHELETGHSPASFLRWMLPHATLQQGLSMLQSDSASMTQFVRAINLKRIKPRLEQFGLHHDSPFLILIHGEFHRRKRNDIVGYSVIPIILGFLGVYMPYVSGYRTGGRSVAIFLLVAILSAGIMGWAQIRYRKRMQQIAPRAGPAKPAGHLPMPTSFLCPGCNKKYRVRCEMAGKRVNCRTCGQVITIPGASPS